MPLNGKHHPNNDTTVSRTSPPIIQGHPCLLADGTLYDADPKHMCQYFGQNVRKTKKKICSKTHIIYS